MNRKLIAVVIPAILTSAHAFQVPSNPRLSVSTISRRIQRDPFMLRSSSPFPLASSIFPNELNQHPSTRLGAKITEDAIDIGADDSVNASDRLSGVLVLLTVPLAWGTYGPVVRLLNKIDPPIPGLVFSASYYTLAAITTLALASYEESKKSDNGSFEQRIEAIGLNFGSLPIGGGIELGSYLFIANCLQIVGLQTVESGRAGFLVQLTTIFVPILEAVFASNFLAVPAKTWAACVVAFMGLIVMGFDGQEVVLDQNWTDSLLAVPSTISSGDILIMLAAVLYTFHVVRLGKFARDTTPIKLAAVKASWEAILSFALVGGLALFAGTGIELEGVGNFVITTGKEISDFFSTFANGIASNTIELSSLQAGACAILWTGWVTCAYTIYAQSYGQSKVSPTNANLIYTFQPIFTAIFAYLLVGETMGPYGFLGGGLIGSAVLLIATSGAPTKNENTGKFLP